MPRIGVTVAQTWFPLVIKASNGRQPESSLISQFFIRGRKCQVNVTATMEAIVSCEVGQEYTAQGRATTE